MVKAILACLICLCSAVSAFVDRQEYTIKFLHLPIGRVSLEERTTDEGRVELLAHSRTNFFGSLIYSLDNTYITGIDRSGGSPLKMVKMIVEKSVQETVSVVYDNRLHQVDYDGRERIDIPAGTDNFFSALRRLRRLRDGELPAQFLLIAHGRLWRADCRAAGRERIRAAGQKVRCRLISVRFSRSPGSGPGLPGRPDLLTKELVHPESKLSLWLTEEAEPRFVRVVFNRPPFEVRLTLVPPEE
jgi:hypothetical protein